MASRIGHFALAAMLISLAGCAMCANPFDCQYAAYGGRLPRTDMVNGRVGSILDPVNGGVLSTHEMQPGETYELSAVTADVYHESRNHVETGVQQATDVEMVDLPASTEDLFSESPEAFDMGFESDRSLGKIEIDRAFESIAKDLPARPSGI